MSGPIRWFVDNPIAANLLMIFLLIGGVLALPALDKQFFPDFELNMVSVTMPYRGAGPSEVEEQICVRIEEAVHDLSGVKEIRSTARQGLGTVIIEAEESESALVKGGCCREVVVCHRDSEHPGGICDVQVVLVRAGIVPCPG